jgi:hypothetical protein
MFNNKIADNIKCNNFDVEILKFDLNKDIALLKTSQIGVPLTFNLKTVNYDKNINCYGYTNHKVCIKLEGKIIAFESYNKTINKIVHTCATRPGISGSPLLDGQNRVIGMHHKINICNQTGNALNFAVPVTELVNFIDNYNYNYNYNITREHRGDKRKNILNIINDDDSDVNDKINMTLYNRNNKSKIRSNKRDDKIVFDNKLQNPSSNESKNDTINNDVLNKYMSNSLTNQNILIENKKTYSSYNTLMREHYTSC